MQIQISVRHGHVSEETQAQIKTKVERLQRYFERLTTIEVTINLERREAPSVDLKVSAEHKHDFVAVSRGENLLAATDVALDKMEQQLRKYKEKVQDRHRNSGGRQAETRKEVPSDTGPEQEV